MPFESEGSNLSGNDGFLNNSSDSIPISHGTIFVGQFLPRIQLVQVHFIEIVFVCTKNENTFDNM